MTPDARSGKPTSTDKKWYRGRQDDSRAAQPAGRREAGVRTVWTGLIVSALIGIALLVFILQNTEQARVQLFFWHFSMPIGVGILLAAVGGGIMMTIIGGLRIWQLRRTGRRG